LIDWHFLCRIAIFEKNYAKCLHNSKNSRIFAPHFEENATASKTVW